MDEVVVLQNIENVCRLCLSDDEPKLSVFGTQETPVSLVSKIQACLSIQILATDKLSTQICAQCVKNVNQWHNYKEACLRSQETLQQWLEKHLQSSPMVVTIKDEPVDLDFYEDNIEVISESTVESDVESNNLEESIEDSVNTVHVQEITDDEGDQLKAPPILTKDLDICIKPEPQEDYDTDCTIEIESVTGSELVLNPLSNKEDTVMEADSTQKSNASASPTKKKIRRGPHTHYRGTRAFKQKCVHCQIFLHSKYSYTKHMERFHTEKQNGDTSAVQLKDEEELVEDLEDELMSMEKDAPLTQVQQNIISQLKTFSCYSCQQSFNDRRSTLSHIRQHMPDLRPYTCIACLTEFPDRSMYKLHCGASFECAMKIALVIPNEGEEKYFTCNMCLRSMQNRKELLSHLSKHSDKQYQQLVSPSRSPPKLKPISPLPASKQEPIKRSVSSGLNIPRPYKNGDPAHNHVCDLCGMIYRYRPNMVKHRDLCQRLQPEVRTSYKCIHCGMTYLVFKKFHNHITLDHKKKDFLCSECGAKFRASSDYLAHHETHRVTANKKPSLERKDSGKGVQNFSTPIKDWDTFEAEMNASRIPESVQYSCALCNLEFATRAELTEHRNLHLKVKIYSCVICRSMFSSAGALEIHMKDHGIEDPNERNANSSCVEYGTVNESMENTNPTNMSVTSDPGSNKNECAQCGKVFSNYANVRRHIRNIHKPNKSYLGCPECPRTFKTKEIFDKHLTSEHNKPAKSMLQCPQCPKTFVFQANLNLHFQTAHGAKRSGGYECDICGKTFIEEASLKIHRGWHNRTNSRLSLRNAIAPTDNDKKPIANSITIVPKQEKVLNASSDKPARARKSFPNSPSMKPEGKFQCQVCNDKFNDVTELRKHLWDVHCAHKTEKSFTGEEFQCDVCSTIFAEKEALNMHMQWHKACAGVSRIRRPRNQGTFPCEVCGKFYSSKKVLWRHKKLHKATTVAAVKFQSLGKKSMPNQHLCNICHKIFCSNQSLQRHRMNLHSDLFNHRQQAVYSSTRRMSQEEPSLKRMKQEEEEEEEEEEEVLSKPAVLANSMHAGKKPVMCHVCRKFFANMSVLYKHKQLMHSKSRMMKNVAKASTTSSTQCIPISGSDGKMSCNICFKSFSGLSNLRQHFTIKHKNSPPKYACPIDGCKLMFPSQSTLKAHEMTHTTMIFNCNLCGRHVFNRQAMTDHMLTAHNTVYDAGKSKNFHRETDLSLYVVQNAVDATCPHCKIKYPNNRAMKIHYFKFHDTVN
ncbi:uncharacterized protein LOC116428877 [Nomia melanderi]|uniref:uncharacterized protein LOC116428877 n=1 Tax=Nomia melanderi TaxID=2448451 RepID=UPI00130400CC|nr:zinc finger protein 62 homolog [Nomia melanderi]